MKSTVYIMSSNNRTSFQTNKSICSVGKGLVSIDSCMIGFYPIQIQISESPLEVFVTTIAYTHTHMLISGKTFITSCGCRCLSVIIHLRAFNHRSPHWFRAIQDINVRGMACCSLCSEMMGVKQSDITPHHFYLNGFIDAFQ